MSAHAREAAAEVVAISAWRFAQSLHMGACWSLVADVPCYN